MNNNTKKIKERIEELKKEIAEPQNLSDKDKAYVYKSLFSMLDIFSNRAGFGDPFNYARSKEIYMACVLGHKIAFNYSGEDAINKNGDQVEYKSTIGKKISATYNGISVLPTWEEQEKYLIFEKIGKYKEHYFARFEIGGIAELYKASGDDVLRLLLPKLKKHYPTTYNKKDPRLGSSLNHKEISLIGKKII